MINNPSTISRQPESLVMNFEELRAEGIQHLEKFATHIWTDFNAHDPGITILEILCYALTDLGYRANFSLEDLLACESGNYDEIFFPAADILSNCPVTELDFRKLIIDLPGIKNAWLEKANGEQDIYWCKKTEVEGEEIVYFRNIGLPPKFNSKDARIDYLLKKYPLKNINNAKDELIAFYGKNIDFESVIEVFRGKLNEEYNSDITELDIKNAEKIIKEILCDAYFILKKEGKEDDEIKLNGLYNICLDFHNPKITPESAAAKRLFKKVENRLHAYRNLCEDFVNFQMVEALPICICLHLEVVQDADSEEIMAEALFKLQEFLTPTLKFHTLQELFEKGKSGDEIYDGPLLENGFLDDAEVRKSILRKEIFTSDLYDVLADIPEISAVRELKLNIDGTGFKSEYCYKLKKGKVKPVLDTCCETNQLWIIRNGISKKIEGQDIEAAIKFKNLVQSDIPDSELETLPTPKGLYRPDLAEFTSIQVEFPRTYGIGENQLPETIGIQRLARVKQLQGYLLFFDQLLANYLKQLSQVRELFSVNRTADYETSFIQALYQVPGVKTLLKDFPCVNEKKIDQIKDKLTELVSKNVIAQSSLDISIGQLETYNGEAFSDENAVLNFIEKIVDKIKNTVDKPFIQNVLNKIILTNYLKELKSIVTDNANEKTRKNQLFDHLISRFGEAFTNYSLQLFQSNLTGETGDNFHQYLEDKATFLSEIPTLSAHRAKAYNCKLFIEEVEEVADSDKNTATHRFNKVKIQPDVWNTENISGLKRKVSLMLGLPIETASIFRNPKYHVKLIRDESKSRSFFIALIELNDSGIEKRTLLVSERSYRKKQATELKDLTQEKLESGGELNCQPTDEESSQQVVFQFNLPNGKEVLLVSDYLTSGQTNRLCEDINALIHPEDGDKEGFHLLEHILLRPNDAADNLLFPPRTCLENQPPIDPYSFQISLIMPGWSPRFQDIEFRKHFEQLTLQNTPVHIAVCFRWVEKENRSWLVQFEKSFELWRETKVNCTPEECDVTEKANKIIELLNTLPCPCCCNEESEFKPKCKPIEHD